MPFPVAPSSLVAAALLCVVAALVTQLWALLPLAAALASLASLLADRPWTGWLSGRLFGGARHTPLFQHINRIVTRFWTILFAAQTLAMLLGWPAGVLHASALAGGLATVIIVRRQMRRGLAAMVAGDQRNPWPAPAFTPAPKEDDRCDVAVIGAGIGGLTAAALLADSGLRVHVYEQQGVVGGFCQSWSVPVTDPARPDQSLRFRFDAGVHDVSGWFPNGTVHSVFRRLGLEQALTWVRLHHRYILDGTRIDPGSDWRSYRDQLCALLPDQAPALTRLFDDLAAIQAGMMATATGRGGIPGRPLTSEAMMDFARAHPLAVRWMERPWLEFLDHHSIGAAARPWLSVLGMYLLHDPDRLRVGEMAALFGYLVQGGHYPLGGSGGIATSLCRAIEARGGRLFLNSPVRQILSQDGAVTGLRITDAEGQDRSIHTPAVVANSDLLRTLDELIEDPAIGQELRQQCGDLQPNASAFGVLLALRGSLNLPPITQLRQDGQGVHIVHISAIDPGAAPIGDATLELLSLLPPDEAVTWLPTGPMTAEGAAEYARRKAAYAETLLAPVRTLIPDLDDRILYRSDTTPLTYRRYGWTSGGSIYGVRPSGAAVPVRSPLRGLVFAGSALHGAGIEAVMIAGADAANSLRPGIIG